jgi:hypothetical protein
MSNVDEMPDLDTSDPAIAELVDRLEDLEQQVEAKEQAKLAKANRKRPGQSVPRMTLEEQFVYDLALTEVDVPGGRRRDAIADGYAKIYDLLMSRVGTELEEYVEANGFTLQLLMATMKVYYSKEGRIVRGEQPRAKGDQTPQPAAPIATPGPTTDGNTEDEQPTQEADVLGIDADDIGIDLSDLVGDDVLAGFVFGDDDD